MGNRSTFTRILTFGFLLIFSSPVLICTNLPIDETSHCRKKRSLRGGIRQTIVVQWPGTIAANSICDICSFSMTSCQRLPSSQGYHARAGPCNHQIPTTRFHYSLLHLLWSECGPESKTLELLRMRDIARPYTDGISAVLFESTRSGTVSNGPMQRPTLPLQTVFVLRVLSQRYGRRTTPQQYASGWGQALRFDSNTTTYRTE